MKNTSHPLDAIERIAVAEAMGSGDKVGDLKKYLKPGIYSGSVDIHVDFTLDKGVPSSALPTSDVLSKAVLAKAIVLSGIQRDHFYAALEEAATTALLAGDKVGDVLSEDDKRVIVEVDSLTKKVIAKLPLKLRSGATRVTAKVSKIVELQIETQAEAANG